VWNLRYLRNTDIFCPKLLKTLGKQLGPSQVGAKCPFWLQEQMLFKFNYLN